MTKFELAFVYKVLLGEDITVADVHLATDLVKTDLDKACEIDVTQNHPVLEDYLLRRYLKDYKVGFSEGFTEGFNAATRYTAKLPPDIPPAGVSVKRRVVEKLRSLI